MIDILGSSLFFLQDLFAELDDLVILFRLEVFLDVLELCFDAGHLDKRDDATRRELSLLVNNRGGTVHRNCRKAVYISFQRSKEARSCEIGECGYT
jgi:hypothetical protein